MYADAMVCKLLESRQYEEILLAVFLCAEKRRADFVCAFFLALTRRDDEIWCPKSFVIGVPNETPRLSQQARRIQASGGDLEATRSVANSVSPDETPLRFNPKRVCPFPGGFLECT